MRQFAPLLALAVLPWPARAEVFPFALKGSKGELLVPGAGILAAEATFDSYGSPAVEVELVPGLDAKVQAFTSAHTGEVIRVLICGDTVLEPRLMTELVRGQFLITVKTPETATGLALTLRRGSCNPVPSS